eukprot:COSAG01_NODE_22940_length_835_cov_1.158967_1_plen_147_part_01
MWLNGVPIREHVGWGGGYTSFTARLDNVTSLKYGAAHTDANVLAVWVDARLGSGWWYEGGGIYRKTWLIRTEPVRLATDGIFVRSIVHRLNNSDEASDIADASLKISATVENTASRALGVTLAFDLFDQRGILVGSATITQLHVTAA